jgi:HK97 gp10 family phage protein
MRRGAVGFHLAGLEEFDRALAELPKAVGKQVLRRASTKVLTPVRDTARQMAPRSGEVGGKGEQLAQTIHVRAKLKRSQMQGRVAAGHVETFVGATAPHAHLVEFGTGPRWQETTGRFTGQMPPRPFMRTAWDQHRGQMLTLLPKLLWEEVYKAARRVRRQSERLVGRLKARRGG